MPNHWHLVVWPEADGALSTYVQWLTVTHVRRWHAHYHSEGTGPIYQGRFKSFPVQEEDHYLTVCRYVERNPLRATRVERAQDWRWSSLWHRVRGTGVSWLSDGPVLRPGDWTEHVNAAQTESELTALRESVLRGAPYGDDQWQEQTAVALGLESSMRPKGRPKKVRKNSGKTKPDPFYFLGEWRGWLSPVGARCAERHGGWPSSGRRGLRAQPPDSGATTCETRPRSGPVPSKYA